MKYELAEFANYEPIYVMKQSDWDRVVSYIRDIKDGKDPTQPEFDLLPINFIKDVD